MQADYGFFKNQIAAETDYYGVNIVTDINFGLKLSAKLKFSIGANNLDNISRDQQHDWVEQKGY